MSAGRVLAALALAVMAGCSPPAGASPPSMERAAEPRSSPVESAQAMATADEAWFVGRLTHNEAFSQAAPLTFCVDGVHYRGSPYRVGRVQLFGDVSALDGVASGAWVVVRGVRHESGLFAQLTEEAGGCPPDPTPPMQWRSDWTADEGGYAQAARVQLEAAGWIEAQGLVVSASPVLTVELPEGAVPRKVSAARSLEGEATVTVVNPLDEPWREVELRLHYETADRGKPMPWFETQRLELPVGEARVLRVPLSREVALGDARRTVVFHGAHLRGGEPAQALGTASFAD